MFPDPTSMLCSAARKSPLAHSEHPFFKRVQLVKSPYPCFLTPLKCFVQQQGKAHLPTLNMPLFYKGHLVQSSNPCPLTPANALFTSKVSPLAHSHHAPTMSTLYKLPIHAFRLQRMLCPAARESSLAHSEYAFFKGVQLVKSRYPSFLTPLQCFVQQQGKAHLPTLNIPSSKECHL